jgi:CheY-like chemotaxis protein
MTAQILAVAESDLAARTIVERLGRGFEGAVSVATGTSREIVAAVAAARPGVVLLGLGTVGANERAARALRDAAAGGRQPLLLTLCGPGDIAAANRLATDGVFDHYLLHPDDLDPGRLAVSARLGLRLAGADADATAPPAAAGADTGTGSSAADATVRPRPVILMIEDDEFTHQLVAVTLASHDVELVFESDGALALDRVREVRPDLVLMDVLLPGGDGVDLTQRLKGDSGLAAIPVVMVTGEARRETLLRSMEAGAVDFIVKPFTPDALVAKLGRFLPSLR